MRLGQPGSHEFSDAFTLAYHRVVAERLLIEPQGMIQQARRNIDRWIASGAFDSGEIRTLTEWRKLLHESELSKLVDLITEESDEGQRLRSSSPFAGVLPPQVRRDLLASCEQRAIA